MTTIADVIANSVLEINDRDSLRLVSRVIDAQITGLESQMVQLKSLQEGIQERVDRLGE
jgi:hypothetical protein